MADSEVIRTVFQTEWMGGGVLGNMIRQYGLAEKAINKLQGTSGKGLSSFQMHKQAGEMKLFNKEIGRVNSMLLDGKLSASEYAMAMNQMTPPVQAATSGLGSFIGGLSKTTIALGAVGVALGAAVLGFKALYPVLEQGAVVSQLDQSFRHLTTTMASGPGVLQEMKDASQGTLTTMAAQEGIMTLVAGSSERMTMELTRAAPKLLEISKAANKLNPALGDTNFMFTSLAKGVKRAEPRLIDNLGLKLRVSDANRTLAEELGKTVMELTAEEKQLALLNETLRAGDQLIEQVGGTVEGVQDPFLRWSTATTEAGDSLKMLMFQAIGVGGALDFLSEQLMTLADDSRNIVNINNAIEEGIVTRAKVAEIISKYPGQAESNKAASDYVDRIRMGLAAQKELEQRRFDMMTSLLNPEEDVEPRYGQTMLLGEQYDLRMKMARAEEDVAAAVEDSTKAREEEAKIFDDLAKVADDWHNSQMKRIQEERDAWLEYKATLTEFAIGAEQADAKTSLFTTSVENMGPGFRRVGGLTEEQKELLEDLESGYDKAAGNVRDYTVGLKGFGDEQDKVNEKIEENQGLMEHLAPQIEALKAQTGELEAVNTRAVWDWDALKSAMADAAGAAGVGAFEYVKLKKNMGLLNEEQAIAIVKSAAVQNQMALLAEDVRLGKIRPEDAFSEVENYIANLESETIRIKIGLEPVTQAQDDFNADIARAENIELGGRGEELGEELAGGVSRSIQEELFGEGVFEPLDIHVEAVIDPAKKTIDGFITQYDGTVIRVNVVSDGVTSSNDCDPGTYYDPEYGGCRPISGGGRAMGGYVPAGASVMVGELGPEMVTFGAGANVTPANKSGGGGVTYAPTYISNTKEAAAISAAQADMERKRLLRGRLGR